MRAFLWLLAFAAAFVVSLWWLQPPGPGSTGRDPANYPWQVERLADGSTRVLGLRLGVDTLADAQARFGPRMQLALFADPGGTLTLEAMYPELTLGGLTARIVLSTRLPEQDLSAFRARAAREEELDSGVRRYTLGRPDARAVLGATLAGLTYLPAADYDEDVLRARFGPPAAIEADPAGVRHFLYPDLGLDAIVDRGGATVLQYVPPREFDRLRRPLTGEAERD